MPALPLADKDRFLGKNSEMTNDVFTPGTTRFLDVAGGRLAYDDTGGDGDLILAIPGMGDLRREYRHLRPALVAAGHRVVTLDVRGFGATRSVGMSTRRARSAQTRSR